MNKCCYPPPVPAPGGPEPGAAGACAREMVDYWRVCGTASRGALRYTCIHSKRARWLALHHTRATLNTKAYPFRRRMAAGPDERKDQHEPFQLEHRGVHFGVVGVTVHALLFTLVGGGGGGQKMPRCR